MDNIVVHRPRNLDWKRAASLLYGDWGTNKAYVIGLAFVAAGFSSLPIIIAVCVLTALVAYNYVIVCKYFPEGGGVYSAARNQSRSLAVVGALLLAADMTVTASLSAWSSLVYLGVPKDFIIIATILLIMVVGVLNIFGPKHSGSFATALALPAIVVVVILIVMALPNLTTTHLTPPQGGFVTNWVAFVGMILALSGVEAIANLTGVMKLDPDATMEKPRVLKVSKKSIFVVAVEVVLGTALLGWAMLSLPQELAPVLKSHEEDMLRFLAEQYGQMMFGPSFAKIFGLIVGVVFGLLLISAVNTAVVALIGLFYMLARDGEMPKPFTRLNREGVPQGALLLAVMLPILTIGFAKLSPSGSENAFYALASLYAIGVVGAIAVNLGSCFLNRTLSMTWLERGIMGMTFVVLVLVEFTVAKTKPDALFFAVCILVIGLALRAYAHKRAGLETVVLQKEVAVAVSKEVTANLKLRLTEGQKIMVAARGVNPVLRFALEEAHLRKGALYVLYVQELAVAMPGSLTDTTCLRWQDDPRASEIMYSIIKMAEKHKVPVIPLYVVSESPASTIVDLAATMGIDFLMLGASNRQFLSKILKGDVASEVARILPEEIQLVIHG